MNAGTTGKYRSPVLVVIATYNEAPSIGELLRRLDYPAIVVDDSSPDGTGYLACQAGAMVHTRPTKSGIASAYREGFEMALRYNPEYVVQMDAGLSHDPADVPRLIGRARQGYGLVIGSRFMSAWPRGRRAAISLIAAWLMRRLGLPVTDATGGFRCWQAGLLEAVAAKPFRARGFAFQLEALCRARGAAIGEIPIKYRLTNSTFRPSMLFEALWIYLGLWRERLQ